MTFRQVRTINRHDLLTLVQRKVDVLRGIHAATDIDDRVPHGLRANARTGVRICDELMQELKELLSPPMRDASESFGKVREK